MINKRLVSYLKEDKKIYLFTSFDAVAGID